MGVLSMFDTTAFLAGLFGPDAGPGGAAARNDFPTVGKSFFDLPKLADWSEFTTPDGRHGWQRADVTDLQVIDLPGPCPSCGGIVFWWDVTGGRHCEACSPRTRAIRLREHAQRLRERYARK
jgi:hypothetical protein